MAISPVILCWLRAVPPAASFPSRGKWADRRPHADLSVSQPLPFETLAARSGGPVRGILHVPWQVLQGSPTPRSAGAR